MTNFINNENEIYDLIYDSDDEFEKEDELDLDDNQKYIYDIFNNNNNKEDEIKKDEHEILIQENEDFIVTRKIVIYGSQINILYELLIFRYYRLIFKNHYDGNMNIYTLFKKINNNCIYILLCDGQYLYDRLKNIIKERDISYNNIILCICSNGIYCNENNQYQFLKVHDRVRITDKFIEKMEYDLIHNNNNDKLRVGYLFFNYNHNNTD